MPDTLVVTRIPGPVLAITKGPQPIIEVVRNAPETVLNVTYSDQVVRVDGETGVGLPRAYRHLQTVPASLWTVTHNLGYYPAGIHVEDSAGADWRGELTYLDLNTLTINFGTSSFSGAAYIS